MSQQSSVEAGKEDKPKPHSQPTQSAAVKVDLSRVNNGIWLVKVPKYLAARWEQIPGDVEAGKVRIYKTGVDGVKPKVTLTLSDATLCLKDPGDDQNIPKEHSLISQTSAHQTLIAFDHIPGTKDDGIQVQQLDKVSILGKVHQKLECRPPSDINYLKLKREETKKALAPIRSVKQLEGVVNNYKPVANHKINIEYDERKKAEGKKTRDEKEKVLEMLFSAFEKHQYYNLKDLVKLTNQPIGYLKEVLKEVCNYVMRSPHRNMWELKPEYRHYKEDLD